MPNGIGNLHFNGHAAKERRRPLGGDNDLGYELLTALAVGDRDGAVLAPPCLNLGAGLGILIPMLLLLEQHDLAHLRELTRQVLPGLLAPPAGGRAGEQDV